MARRGISIAQKMRRDQCRAHDQVDDQVGDQVTQPAAPKRAPAARKKTATKRRW